MSKSDAQLLAELPDLERNEIIDKWTIEEAAAILADWKFWARPEQLAPLWDWFIWAVITGRGWGKTRTGAEFVMDRVIAEPDEPHRVALVSRTAADVRDVMVEGDSGLAEVCERRGIQMIYKPSRRQIVWPDFNAQATTFSAEEPESLRGPQQDTAWGDEPAAWSFIVDAMGNTAWSNLILGLRLGNDPRCIVTTTPKPIEMISKLITDSEDRGNKIALTKGSLYDNRANLAKTFVQMIESMYAGTSIEAQEIHGILLAEVPGSKFKMKHIEDNRVVELDRVPPMREVVIGVDPAFGDGLKNDLTGIVVVGVEAKPVESLRRHFYVLDDLSRRATPLEWARVVVEAYHRFGANYVVVEKNLGGEQFMLDTIASVDASVRVETVSAKVGKLTRAEDVSLPYEQGRVHHVGTLGALEAEMISYAGRSNEKSPDRMDALVYGLKALLGPANQRQARTSASIVRGRKLPSTRPV